MEGGGVFPGGVDVRVEYWVCQNDVGFIFSGPSSKVTLVDEIGVWKVSLNNSTVGLSDGVLPV